MGPPMWRNENRTKYKRDHLRYPSDLTDEEWSHVEPLIPLARRGGRKRETNMREALNAIMYVLSTGCQWRYLPRDFPPRSTVYRYFCDWGFDGTLDRIHDGLYEKCHEQAGREAKARMAIVQWFEVHSMLIVNERLTEKDTAAFLVRGHARLVPNEPDLSSSS